LVRVHPVVRGDLLDRPLPLNRVQCNPCLHLPAKTSPSPRLHATPFRGARFYTLNTCPNFGEHLRSVATQTECCADPDPESPQWRVVQRRRGRRGPSQ
jgi:hypothetical protein